MTTQHTEGHWSVYEYDNPPGHAHYEIVGGTPNAHYAIAQTITCACEEANAEFIVRACNSYDDLLEALEEIETAGSEMHDHFGSLMEGLKRPGSSWNAADMRQYQMQRALKRAAAAIAKATGGTP